MIEPLILSEYELARWRAVIDRWGGDPTVLIGGFKARWEANATGFAPADLPKLGGDLSDLGWSQSFEMFLLSHEAQSPETDLIIRAVMEASREWGKYGDAWLADILALRRSPPPIAVDDLDRSPVGVALEVAAFIVSMIHRFAGDLPEPNPASFAYVRRLHNATTTALVSEVVEDNDQGSVWRDFQMGRRIAPPSARSVFRALAARQRFTQSRQWSAEARNAFAEIRVDWAAVIRELVDTLVVVNEGFVEASREALITQTDDARQTLERHSRSLARQFDPALYRLILADKPENRDEPDRKYLDRLRNLLTTSFDREAPDIPLFGLRLDGLSLRGKLWGGVDVPPPEAPDVSPDESVGPFVEIEIVRLPFGLIVTGGILEVPEGLIALVEASFTGIPGKGLFIG